MNESAGFNGQGYQRGVLGTNPGRLAQAMELLGQTGIV
jgi:hypothetical protein